jgi:hypothetical protein
MCHPTARNWPREGHQRTNDVLRIDLDTVRKLIVPIRGRSQRRNLSPGTQPASGGRATANEGDWGEIRAGGPIDHPRYGFYAAFLSFVTDLASFFAFSLTTNSS